MKNISKILTVIVLCVISNHLLAQTIFENFDNYGLGDNLTEVSPYFLPWNDDPSVDTKITNEESFSGENSIRVYNNGDDYYTDLILQIYQGEAYIKGVYEFNTKMMIKTDKKAFIRLDSNIGGGLEHYSILCEDGICMIENSEGYGLDGIDRFRKVYFAFPYPENEWFDLNLRSYMGSDTYNVDVRVNDICYGQVSFSNSFKSIISYNIWAIDEADFYLDDLTFSQINPEYEAGENIYFLNVNNRIYGIEGENFTINGGLVFYDSISSYTLELNNDGDIQEYQFVPPIESNRDDYFCIQPNFQFDKNVNATMRLAKINGEPIETNPIGCENENQLIFLEIPEDRRRSVFVEGITNNKAGSRVEIEVMLDLMQEKFPNNVSLVSVHNSIEDPLPTYGIAGLSTFTGFYLIDQIKEPLFNPNLERLVLERMNTPAVASLRNAASLDGNTLNIMTAVSSFSDIPSGWTLEHLLVQDNFMGEGEAYDLVNGFGEGQVLYTPSCEYKYAPAIIPASEAEYDRIPRAYLKDLQIDAMASDEENIYTVQVELEGITELEEDLKIISLLVNEEGIVENSKTTSLSKALEIDLSTNTNEVLVSTNQMILKRIEENKLEVVFEDIDVQTLEIWSMQGVLMSSYKNVGDHYQIDISSFAKGMYLIVVPSESGIQSEKFVKN